MTPDQFRSEHGNDYTHWDDDEFNTYTDLVADRVTQHLNALTQGAADAAGHVVSKELDQS